MPFTKPPFFQWPVKPVGSRGLGETEVPDECVICGVHFAEDTMITNPSVIVEDPNADHILISYWLRTTRDDVTEPFYVVAIWNPSALPQMQLASFSNDPTNGSPSSNLLQTNPLTQYNELRAQWPTAEAENVDNLGGNDNQWMHVLLQLNAAGERPGVVLINGLQYGPELSITQGADTIAGLANLPLFIGGTGEPGSENFLLGDIAEFWVGYGIDALEPDGTFSDATIAKFLGPGNTPVPLGEHGQLPFAWLPTIFLHVCEGDDPDDFLINRGSSSSFVYEAGALTLAGTLPPGPEPRPVGLFEITGGGGVGQVLSISGAWANAPTLIEYQWWGVVGEPVTTPTYTPVAGDIGSFIWCVIVATNAAGSTFVDTSITPQQNERWFGPITA